jgi:hypothetical protein
MGGGGIRLMGGGGTLIGGAKLIGGTLLYINGKFPFVYP